MICAVEVNACCLADGADVLYNKFNVSFPTPPSNLSPPNNPPRFPNTRYSCVVATAGQWRVSRCTELHRVVCQSDTLTSTGIITTYNMWSMVAARRSIRFSLSSSLSAVLFQALGPLPFLNSDVYFLQVMLKTVFGHHFFAFYKRMTATIYLVTPPFYTGKIWQ